MTRDTGDSLQEIFLGADLTPETYAVVRRLVARMAVDVPDELDLLTMLGLGEPTAVEHEGSRARYRAGCRCRPCKDAASAYMRTYKDRTGSAA